MLLSVITVCYNCEDQIEKTIQSLQAQTFCDFEYVIIDGASSDGTLVKIREYESSFSNITIISESDKGIYDAMNKGIANAKGDYVYFLNAGDTFYDQHVLDKVVNYLKEGKAIYFGSVLKAGKVEKYPSKLNSFYLVWLERMICHQAIFAHRSAFTDNLFDMQYKICADRVWLLKALKAKQTYEYMRDVIVAKYDMSGVSSQYSNCANDSMKVVKEYGGYYATFFVKIKRAAGCVLRNVKVFFSTIC